MIRRLVAAFAALSFVLLASAADEKIPIETFFKISEYAAMNLSPDGLHIAALSPVAGGRQGLVIIDVKARKATPIVSLSDRDVVNTAWINNKRLFFSTGRLGERDADQRGGDIVAIDLDGSDRRPLRIDRPASLIRFLPGETDEVIAQEFGRTGGISTPGGIYRYNTRNGRHSLISLGKPDSGQVEGWLVDKNGVARGFEASSPGSRRVYYREGPDAPWQKLAEFNDEVTGDTWTLAGLSEDGKLYVSSSVGRDKAAIVEYDPKTKTLGEIVAQHPQVNLTTFRGDYDGSIRGVFYNADKTGVAWLDPTLASVQKTVDNAFPDNVNSLSWSNDRNLFLVTSRSDVLPGSFYLFDRKAGKMEWLGDSRPWIDPKKMSPMQPVRYKARDGLEIPAYLTIPKGSSGKNLPLVMVVHGGPWVPGDTWGFSSEVQFLASRGYAVLQPNYRGTTRYGWKHFSSSFKQWGLAMQDDVTDGVAWAVQHGIADPKRVCIYGGSYGGYAAMMGVAKDPDVYKCAVNYVGVTDLPLLRSATWSDSYDSDFNQYSQNYRLGEGDLLKKVSPTNLAANIKAPVMMAYGAADVRVVPEHGTFMKSALEKANHPPEVWMMVDGEGHGFQRLENQVMFYGAMEKFLDKHIGAK
jgi:dipeptidyl aminopeptidase/acylaminoacyl peptidase